MFFQPYAFVQTPLVGAQLWTPAQISTVFWYDADDYSSFTLSGSSVSVWGDKSGNNNDATQSVAANKPTYSATASSGSLPGVTFDGTNDSLSVATTAGQNQTHGIYWVFSRSGAGSGDAYRPDIGILPNPGSDCGALHYIKTDNLGASYPYLPGAALGQAYDLASGTAYVNGSPNVMSFQSNTTGWGVWRTGTLEGTTAGITTPNNLNIGYVFAHQPPGTRYTNGVYSEALMVEVTDTTTRQKIEGYLAWKWGLEANLPADHPYKNSPPYV